MGLRILLLTTDAYGGHGGIALYNRDIVQALAAMPEVEEITVIPRIAPLPREPIPEKVRILSPPTAGKSSYIRTVLGVTGKAFGLVICGHINLLPVAVPLNAIVDAPLVLMVYGIDVWTSRRALSRFWLQRVDSIWSISAITRDRMNAWARLPEETYTLLPNAIHLERYGLKEKSAELVARYGLDGSTVILTLARLPGAERYKGVDEVIEAMPALLAKEPRLKYVIAGDGDDRSRLEAKARSMGLADHIVFTGMVEESEKADVFRLADAFVMPGRGEGFGFVFLEAMACGVPTVGSTVDGSREALRDGTLGELVDPGDKQSLLSGTLRALSKPKGIPAGLAHFAWPAFAARLADAVRPLIGVKPGKPRSGLAGARLREEGRG